MNKNYFFLSDFYFVFRLGLWRMCVKCLRGPSGPMSVLILVVQEDGHVVHGVARSCWRRWRRRRGRRQRRNGHHCHRGAAHRVHGRICYPHRQRRPGHPRKQMLLLLWIRIVIDTDAAALASGPAHLLLDLGTVARREWMVMVRMWVLERVATRVYASNDWQRGADTRQGRQTHYGRMDVVDA